MSAWVLLRGLARESAHWSRFPEALQSHLPPGAAIVALDLPGTGVERLRRSPDTVPDIAAQCRRSLQARGVAGPIHLIGLSLGGMVAAAWARQWPAEVRGLVLVNSSAAPISPVHHRLRPSAWPALLRIAATRDARRAERAVLRLTSTGGASDTELLERWTDVRLERPVSPSNAFRQLCAAVRYQLPARSPDMPALVVCSQGDRLVNPDCSRRLADDWSCRAVQHPWAGHDLALDDPGWLAEQVAAWHRTAATSS